MLREEVKWESVAVVLKQHNNLRDNATGVWLNIAKELTTCSSEQLLYEIIKFYRLACKQPHQQVGVNIIDEMYGSFEGTLEILLKRCESFTSPIQKETNIVKLKWAANRAGITCQ